jgi:hypothetical protein
MALKFEMTILLVPCAMQLNARPDEYEKFINVWHIVASSLQLIWLSIRRENSMPREASFEACVKAASFQRSAACANAANTFDVNWSCLQLANSYTALANSTIRWAAISDA